MKRLFLFLGLFFSLGFMVAGQAPEEKPREPLITPVPTYAFYVVKRLPNPPKTAVIGTQNDIESKEEIAEKKRDPEAVVEWRVRKAEKVILVQGITQSGHRGEVWYINDHPIIRAPGRNEYFVFNDGYVEPMNLNFGHRGYPWTDWIGIDNYIGRFNLNGRKCLFFQTRIAVDDITIPVSAYIDDKSRVPLIVRYGESYYEFAYFPAPQTHLAIPAPVAAAKSNFESAMERLQRMPARPY